MALFAVASTHPYDGARSNPTATSSLTGSGTQARQRSVRWLCAAWGRRPPNTSAGPQDAFGHMTGYSEFGALCVAKSKSCRRHSFRAGRDGKDSGFY